MTKNGFYCILSVLSLSLVTSCFSDGGQKVNLGNYPGVVVKRKDSAYFHLKGNTVVYSSKANSGVDNGDCVILDFTLDYGLKENADSGSVRGFYTVNITKTIPVPNYDLLVEKTDTSALLPNEQIISSIQQGNTFILNRLFLYTNHPVDTLPLNFALSYNPQQTTTDHVYDLFLRVSHKTDAAVGTQPTVQYNAFNLEELSRKETDSLFFRINYIQSVNKDSTQLLWKSSDVYRYGL